MLVHQRAPKPYLSCVPSVASDQRSSAAFKGATIAPTLHSKTIEAHSGAVGGFILITQRLILITQRLIPITHWLIPITHGDNFVKCRVIGKFSREYIQKEALPSCVPSVASDQRSSAAPEWGALGAWVSQVHHGARTEPLVHLITTCKSTILGQKVHLVHYVFRFPYL